MYDWAKLLYIVEVGIICILIIYDVAVFITGSPLLGIQAVGEFIKDFLGFLTVMTLLMDSLRK